jgi:hypothetical protein
MCLCVVLGGINTKHQSPQRSWTRIQKNFAFYVPLYCPKEETQSIKVHKGAGLESKKNSVFYLPLCCPKRNKHKASKSTKEQDSNP